MVEVLTLAITETKNQKFKIVVYDIDNNKYYSLDLIEDEFYYDFGKPAWDLFGITRVEKLIPTNNNFYIPSGKAIVSSYYDKNKIKAFFRRNNISLKKFVKSKMNYSIIKINEIKLFPVPSIPKYENRNKIQQKIKVSDKKKFVKTLLNKDYKWLNYWSFLPKKQWKKKRDKWYNYLNRPDKHIYAVVNNYWTSEGEKYTLISGLHCL